MPSRAGERPPPSVNRSFGVPVTSTGSEKRTSTRIASPGRKVPPPPLPLPESRTRVTDGARVSEPPPSTTTSPFVIAWVPRPSAALLPAASAIVPPFSVSAEVPMLIPSASASAATTV